MQVSNTLLAIVVEFYLALLVGLVFLFIHARKLKSLIRRQQEKILALLRRQQETPAAEEPPAPSLSDFSPTQNYKAYLNQELEYTAEQFASIAPNEDISVEQSTNNPLFQRILALRYAFLRAEELGTTEFGGTEEYWNIFQQALEPLLAPSGADNSDLQEELETCKKRIENLEKFKRLFFEMEQQWSAAQANAQDYYAQLMAMSDQVTDKEGFSDILNQYHGVYDSIHNTIVSNTRNPESATEYKTINITRQDPRAAEEIFKLRNVAADQHRVINQLQRRLIEATTAEEKESLIQELQLQLQKQTRFVQESETCVQLLEEELSKAQEELSLKERVLHDKEAIDEENKRMKDTLHNFAVESGELMLNIDMLEKENDALKQNGNPATEVAMQSATSQTSSADSKQLQSELMQIKKQYAELEEKYLDLKLGS